MIDWKLIETAPSTQVLLYIPPLKLREAVVFVGRADECRRSATHWAHINAPGDPQDIDMTKDGIEEYSQQQETTP